VSKGRTRKTASSERRGSKPRDKHRPTRSVQPELSIEPSSALAELLSAAEEDQRRWQARPPLNSEMDWNAWEETLKCRPMEGALPREPYPHVTTDAVAAVQAAANEVRASENAWRITEESIEMAALLTAVHGRLTVFDTLIVGYRLDILIEALNRYPHPRATACRFLVPAIRNLVMTQRETPEDLWNAWRHEQHQVHDLTVHPWSPRFQDEPLPQYAALDYQSRPLGPTTRDALSRWRIWAHLFEVPTDRSLADPDVVRNQPALSTERLKALTTFTANYLGGFLEPSRMERWAAPLRVFLAEAASFPVRSVKERTVLRDALVHINRASVRGLAKRFPLCLGESETRAYKSLLRLIRSEWRKSQKLGLRQRAERRLQYVKRLGWDDPDGKAQAFLTGQDLALTAPREVAALLVCMQKDLGIYHPQTIFEALAEARRVDALVTPFLSLCSRSELPPKRRTHSLSRYKSD
jgi:hypothetical protein